MNIKKDAEEHFMRCFQQLNKTLERVVVSGSRLVGHGRDDFFSDVSPTAAVSLFRAEFIVDSQLTRNHVPLRSAAAKPSITVGANVSW